jgi:hypothetical protein
VSEARRERWLAWAVFLATVLVMAATHRAQGHSRDEGYYFEAARQYEGWFLQLGRDVREGRLLEPLRDATLQRYWRYNWEHPPVAKASFALSHLVFARGLGWLDAEAAWRLPEWLFAGLLSLALFRLARRWGLAAAVLAPALFWAVPRHFYHAHHACFDVPIAALWCWFLVEYARWLETRRQAWRVGVWFGLAMATKHNAFFLPIAVVLHWLVTERRELRAAGLRGLWGRIPRAFWSMALVGPLVLYALWPLLWHHPVDGVNRWLGFHRHHVHYPWQYFGTVLRAPPFPWEYPLALEAVTLPAATLLAIALGLGRMGWHAARGRLDAYEWLLAFGILLQIAPFMTTAVPIFGGIKHWMPAVALACVPAARLLVEACEAVLTPYTSAATALLAALVLVPGVWSTARFHPYGTSAYNELAGGAAGGAALGMQRQYWSNNVTAVLPWLAEHAAPGARVYFHEVNHESFRAYQAEGAIRADVRYAWAPQDADVAIYQYHQEFRDREFEIWTLFGTRVPALSFAIDEATQVVVYVRGG